MDFTAEEDWTTHVMGQPQWQKWTLQNQQSQNGSHRQGQWPCPTIVVTDRNNGPRMVVTDRDNGTRMVVTDRDNGPTMVFIDRDLCRHSVSDQKTLLLMLSVSDQKTKSTMLLTLSLCQARRQCCATYAVMMADQKTVLLMLSQCQTRQECCATSAVMVSDQKTVLLMLSQCLTRRHCYLCCHNVGPAGRVQRTKLGGTNNLLLT